MDYSKIEKKTIDQMLDTLLSTLIFTKNTENEADFNSEIRKLMMDFKAASKYGDALHRDEYRTLVCNLVQTIIMIETLAGSILSDITKSLICDLDKKALMTCMFEEAYEIVQDSKRPPTNE